MKTVKNESDLYPYMCTWLNEKLEDSYFEKECEIVVLDASQQALDKILEEQGVIQYFPQTIGLGIQIDVLGIVKFENSADIYFIEAKKGNLTLRDLGQLLIYCKLCHPTDAWLLTPGEFGQLSKILVNQNREDLLDYGSKEKIKMLKVAKWNIDRNTIDYQSIIPKI